MCFKTFKLSNFQMFNISKVRCFCVFTCSGLLFCLHLCVATLLHLCIATLDLSQMSLSPLCTSLGARATCIFVLQFWDAIVVCVAAFFSRSLTIVCNNCRHSTFFFVRGGGVWGTIPDYVILNLFGDLNTAA